MSEISDKSNSHKINEIKTILRSLLISEGSRDVTVHLLNTRYKDMEDRDIPFKDFNYSNLTDFLRSMTDTLKLKFNKDKILCVYHINSEKSAHISSLVARQKKPPKKIKSTYSDRSYTNYSSFNKPNQTFFPNYIDILNQVLQEVKCSGTASIRNGGIRKSEILSRVKNRLGNQFSNSYTIRTLNEHLYKISHMICIENDYIYFKDRVNKNGINNTQENCTTKIVASNSDSLNTLEANNDPFPILNDNEQNFNSEINSSSNVTEQTKIRLQKLLQKHPEGIWCSELPNLYRYDYNIDLEYSDLGFNSITEFVAALPDIFQIVQPPNSNRQMVLCPKTFTNSSKSNHQTKTLTSLYNFDDFIASDQEPVPIKLSIDVSRKLVPDGVMSLNETVDQICITSLVHEEYIEVNISEIFTPSFFWITLRKNKKKIQALMNELEEFYNKEDLDTYKIPQVILEPGLNVACTYSKVWHRGIVKKIKPDGFVVILFYDYGTIKTYNPNDLYFLNKKFSHLSAQAVACGLYNIKPIGGSEWSNESINKFIDKVWNIPLIAIISTINEENNTMMITLTDTSDDLTDLHINDWMIENKLAAWGKMVCIRNNFIFQHYQKCLQKNSLSVTNIESTKTIPSTENIFLSELSSTSTQNCVSYATKIAALKTYNVLHYNLSNHLSTDKLIQQSNTKNMNESNSFDKQLFHQCKKLLVPKQISNSRNTIQTSVNQKEQSDDIILQQDYVKASDNLQSLLVSTELESRSSSRKQLIFCDNFHKCQSNEIIDFQNVRENFDQMKSIDNSLENPNNALLLNSYNFLFYHLKKLKSRTT